MNCLVPSTSWLSVRIFPPRVIDLAHLISIVHQEVPSYSLLYHNCWWFAPEIFTNLARRFLQPEDGREEILNLCKKRTLKQAEAPYCSRWRGRVVRSGFFIVTIPVFPVAWPLIIMGMLGLHAAGRLVLRNTNKLIRASFDEYLAKKNYS